MVIGTIIALIYFLAGASWAYALLFKTQPPAAIVNNYEFVIQNRIITPMRSKPPVAPVAPKPSAPTPPHFNPEGVTNSPLIEKVLEAKRNMEKSHLGSPKKK